MKTGRPSHHIPARWIFLNCPSIPFKAYKLDNKGNLFKDGNNFVEDKDFDFQKVQENITSFNYDLIQKKPQKKIDKQRPFEGNRFVDITMKSAQEDFNYSVFLDSFPNDFDLVDDPLFFNEMWDEL